MHSWRARIRALAAALFWLGFAHPPAMAESSRIEVDMQLVLAVDISFSISRDEQDIQRRGYVAAFRDPEVIRAITTGVRGRISVTFLEWAGEGFQTQVVPWTLIHDPASARAFSDRLESMPVYRKGRTSMSQALEAALELFRQSPFRANRHVVDISADGFNNNGPRIDRIRELLVYHGVTINGLPLMAGKESGLEASLGWYFEDCVIGGPGSFAQPVLSWQEFGATLNRKLVIEIARPRRAPAVARVVRVAEHGTEHGTEYGAEYGTEYGAKRPKMDCLTGEKEDLRQYIQQLEDAVGTDRAPRWIPRKQDWPMPD